MPPSHHTCGIGNRHSLAPQGPGQTTPIDIGSRIRRLPRHRCIPRRHPDWSGILLWRTKCGHPVPANGSTSVTRDMFDNRTAGQVYDIRAIGNGITYGPGTQIIEVFRRGVRRRHRVKHPGNEIGRIGVVPGRPESRKISRRQVVFDKEVFEQAGNSLSSDATIAGKGQRRIHRRNGGKQIGVLHGQFYGGLPPKPTPLMARALRPPSVCTANCRSI